MEKAILVVVERKLETFNIDYRISELTGLANSIDIMCVDVITQKLEKNNPGFLVGKGKVEEIKNSVIANEADLVIFDDELSKTQLSNLVDALDIRVIDRPYLILTIFERRALTSEAKMEIELAKLIYSSKKMDGLNKGLTKQRGGSLANKGKGETTKELDRRKTQKRILFLQEALAKNKQKKAIEKEKRTKNNEKLVVLVGYTNAGKSTTMNAILDRFQASEEKKVYAENKLFATLTTSIRKVKVDNTQSFLLADTVGFVSNLPHELINSFYSTLSIISEASLIIQVVDLSDRYLEEQIKITNDVIDKLGAKNTKMLYLLNKSDLVEPTYQVNDADFLVYSNKNKDQLDHLINYIVENTKIEVVQMKIMIPYEHSSLVSIIEKNAKVKVKLYESKGIYYQLEIGENYYDDLKSYLV